MAKDDAVTCDHTAAYREHLRGRAARWYVARDVADALREIAHGWAWRFKSLEGVRGVALVPDIEVRTGGVIAFYPKSISYAESI